MAKRSRYRTSHLRAALRSRENFSGFVTPITGPISRSHPSPLISATTRAECRSPAKPRIRSRQYPKYLKDLLHYSTRIGGAMFRRVAGICLMITLLASLGLSSAYWWNTRSYSALGMLVCSVLGLLLLILVPWHRYLPGFALYQSYSPFFLIRHAALIFFLSLMATLLGIPLSYFLPRWRRKA